MTYHDLLRKIHETPFQPFRIRLSNNSTVDVREPRPVIVGEASAVVPVEIVTDDRGFRVVRDWTTVSIRHIVEFVDLKEKDSGSRRNA